MKITICGAGSLGHVCLGVLSSQPEVEVSLLTGHPDCWEGEVRVTDVSGKVFAGRPSQVSAEASDLIPTTDLVLLCVPGYLIEPTLRRIAPCLRGGTVVGSIVSSTGFFFFAHEILPPSVPLFGFQRVPFIARVATYGQSANLLGYKPSLAVACEHIASPEAFCDTLSRLFLTPVTLLGSFYEAALTNSNPILHTSRLYTMWRHWDGTPFDRCLLFYKEWTVEAARCLIDMDSEFMALLDRLPMRKECVPSLLEYYGQSDAESLTGKLRSIAAFQSLPAPMRQLSDGGWVPDFGSRYFTEDFPFGLRFIVELARQHGVAVPLLEEVLAWGLSQCGKE